MSYILDALRKADAQRERDPARGIHAHPVAVANEPSRLEASRMPLYAAGGVVAIGIVAWLAWPHESPTQASAVIAAPVPSAVAATSIQPPPPPPVEAPLARVAAPVATPVAAAPASAAPNADRIVTITELPADIQQGLPKLPISGGVYSDNAAQRMLIVGGQVANEGAEIAPGLVLEQIRNKQAVLRFRGWRYLVDY